VETPTLVLIGEADTDTPNVASSCAAAVQRLRRAGRPIDITLYPGAGHGYDQPGAFHAEATRDSRAKTVEFLGRHLRAAR
jgi:dienelactone hydrolase